MEKKLAAREANRAREESPDMPPGRMDLMGDGEDSFAAAKARCGVVRLLVFPALILHDPTERLVEQTGGTSQS